MEQNPKLRLHVEEDLAREHRWQQRLHVCLPEAKGLADQFEATTGWLLSYRSAAPVTEPTEDETQRSVFGRFEIADLSEKWPPGKPAVSRVECERLLAQINRLVGKIESMELDRQRATSAPVDATEDSPLLPTNNADKVANLLRFAKSEMSAIGAAVYLLDDATTHLRLRSMIAPAAFAPDVESVRPLENALADLESLIGNHVNIHTPEMGETWRIPQPFNFGWCCLLGTKNLPLGTLWIFFSQPRTLDAAKSEFLSSLSNQVYSEINSRENPESVDADSALLRQELLLAARSNDARLPSFAPEIDGWKLAGWTYRQGYLASTFHDWAVTPSGNLSVAIGQVVGPMLTAAMSLNNLRSLLSAHRDYRHSGVSLIAKLNEQVWCNSPGDEMASLIYALVDPETDQVQMVNAGDGGVVLGGPFGIQSIDQFQTPLGVDLETPYVQWERALQETETLVMFTQGLRHAISESVASACDADLLRPILLRNHGQPQAILAEIEERFFRSDFQHVAGDLSVLVLSRNSAPPNVHQLAAEMSQSILAELRADHENTLEALAKRLEHGDDWDDSTGYSPIIEVGRQDFDPDWSSDDVSDLSVLEPDTDDTPEIDEELAAPTVEPAAKDSDPPVPQSPAKADSAVKRQEAKRGRSRTKSTGSAKSKTTRPSKTPPQASTKSSKKSPQKSPQKSSSELSGKASAKSSRKTASLGNSQTKSQTKLAEKSAAKSNPAPKSKSNSTPKFKPKSKPESKSKPNAQAEAKINAQTDVKIKGETTSKVKDKASAKTQPAVKTRAAAVVTPAAKSPKNPPAKPAGPKNSSGRAAKTALLTPPKPTANPTQRPAKSKPQPVAKPRNPSAAKPGAKPGTKLAAKPAAKPAVIPASDAVPPAESAPKATRSRTRGR